MSAFVSVPALFQPNHSKLRKTQSCRLTSLKQKNKFKMSSSWSQDDGKPSSMSLDPLSGFEAFCWRTQDALCNQTAEMDGLGTFNAAPFSFPRAVQSPKRTRHKFMQGGRAFESASIDVWTSSTISRSLPSRVRQGLFTEIDLKTGSIEYCKESVGVSLKLLPRNPVAPALRANVHYFQLGGGCISWWFSGTVDVSLGPASAPNSFDSYISTFLQTWQQLCNKHRASKSEMKRQFLDDCLAIGEDLSVSRMDRDIAFCFINEMMEGLLPAYIPLIDHAQMTNEKFGHQHWDDISNIDVFGCLEDEQIEQFCISGGASCESTTLRAFPFGSWRFSLAPSSLTAAGKVYDTLRNR